MEKKTASNNYPFKINIGNRNFNFPLKKFLSYHCQKWASRMPFGEIFQLWQIRVTLAITEFLNCACIMARPNTKTKKKYFLLSILLLNMWNHCLNLYYFKLVKLRNTFRFLGGKGKWNIPLKKVIIYIMFVFRTRRD